MPGCGFKQHDKKCMRAGLRWSQWPLLFNVTGGSWQKTCQNCYLKALKTYLRRLTVISVIKIQTNWTNFLPVVSHFSYVYILTMPKRFQWILLMWSECDQLTVCCSNTHRLRCRAKNSPFLRQQHQSSLLQHREMPNHKNRSLDTGTLRM